TIFDHLRLNRPGSIFTSGGGSLGWNGGAAIGAKLASPQSTVMALTGDGSYMFSIPSTVHWIARHYRTPFLQVVYNNRGWKSPKLSALAIHPGGYASRANEIGVSFDPPPDYAGIAAASGGAFARTVRHVEELEEALEQAMIAVREERRCAVLDVWLPHL
ncbi:MAG TPA: thiamine pyrophosphate-dependent enzyme, partial [Hyphomicrobiales bacterium]|nr:thiamine pyrophosphate-dependent enzyme [Hyphomicrobiales bacterium]